MKEENENKAKRKIQGEKKNWKGRNNMERNAYREWMNQIKLHLRQWLIRAKRRYKGNFITPIQLFSDCYVLILSKENFQRNIWYLLLSPR